MKSNNPEPLKSVFLLPQVPESKAPLPPKPSVLNPPNAGQRPASPSSSSGLTPSPELRHSPLIPPTLEELKSQLKDLRASVELLKSQHRYADQPESRRPGGGRSTWGQAADVCVCVCLCTSDRK